jgi:hypothetical protein
LEVTIKYVLTFGEQKAKLAPTLKQGGGNPNAVLSYSFPPTNSRLNFSGNRESGEAMMTSKDELFRAYGLITENWRFQVNSNWQRTNYFALFETALLGGTWKIISERHIVSGFAAAFLGIALTVVWLLNDVKAGSYIAYWWASLGDIEKAIQHADHDEKKEPLCLFGFVSNYELNAKKYGICRPCWPSYNTLMRAVPSLFFVGWFCILVFDFYSCGCIRTT